MKTTISRWWMAICLIACTVQGAYAGFTPQQCDETKTEYLGAIERRRSDITDQISEHPEMRATLLSAQLSWENTRMAELNAILHAQGCTPANPPPPFEPPTTTVVVEPPTTTVVVEPPTTTVVVEPPTTTVVVEPPITTVVVEPPITTVVVEPPTTTVVVEPPTTTVVVEPPTTTVVVEPPTTTVVVEPPTTTIVVEPPEGCPKRNLSNSDACKAIVSRWESQRNSICGGAQALQEYDDMFHAQLAANGCTQHSGHYCTPGFSHGANNCPRPPQNHAPVIVITGVTISGYTQTITARVTDIDGDRINYHWSKSMAGGSLTNVDGLATLDSRGMSGGEVRVTLSVDDGRGGTDSKSVLLTVASVNPPKDPPKDPKDPKDPKPKCPKDPKCDKPKGKCDNVKKPQCNLKHDHKTCDKKDVKKDCKKVSIKCFRHQDGHTCRLTRAHDRKGCTDPSRKG